ncbi:MAG: hypothetical protein IJT11_00195 [Bacteroidaceae bacterium]|nr:hypothetical protein [Bacteroidaceae bacterium]
MNNDDLFRQALQRQNDRAAGMKMPDDMEQRVMGSLQDPPQPSLKGRESFPFKGELERVWRSRGVWVTIAASVLLLILLNIEKQKPEQPPVVTEKVMQPKDNIEETPQATVSTTIEQPVVAQTKKPQPAKKRRKVHKPILEEPVPQEAEPAQVEPEQENEYLPQQPDLYLLAVADAQDIRSRGERLYEEVAQMMNNH